MDFKQLRSFVAVVDCGSFTKAAARLYTSQPTVSAHIRQLEDELHERLFLRTTKSLAITPRGRELYEYAAHVLSLQDRLLSSWSEDQHLIRLGSSTSPSAYILPELLHRFQEQPGVKYLRVGRKESYPVYPEDYSFEPGKGAVLREGKDAVIVASGIMVHEALEAAKQLAAQGVDAAVIDPITVKPLDETLIRRYAEQTRVVVTAENHNKIGGLTSAVQAAICGMAVKFGTVAIEDEFGEVGPQPYLRERFALTDAHILQVVKSLLGR